MRYNIIALDYDGCGNELPYLLGIAYSVEGLLMGINAISKDVFYYFEEVIVTEQEPREGPEFEDYLSYEWLL
jgi:hypothetical protein